MSSASGEPQANMGPARTSDAVALLLTIVDARLSRRLTTVVDATNGVADERAQLLAIAARHHIPAVAVVVTTDLQTCLARQHARPGPAAGQRWGRAVPPSVVTNQHARTAASLTTLAAEGCTQVIVVDTGSPASYPSRMMEP